jgi:hypothetical protein
MKYLYTLAVSTAIWAVALPVLAQMGPPPIPMSPTQFSGAAIGQSVQIAVRVQRVERSTLYAELLARETDTLSKATGKQVVLFFPDGTPVIMGTASDVVPGAVLYVYGVVTKAGHVDAKRVVVDTKYVTVQ